MVAMVVQPNEFNAFDQRHLQYALEAEGMRVIRVTLKEIMENGKLEDNNKLFVSVAGESLEVAIAYLRAGYDPSDYPSQTEWDARLLVEKSATISCPDCATQLIGTKKVQQVFSVDGVIEKYLSADEASQVKSTFAVLHSLDRADYQSDDDIEKIVHQVCSKHDDYVLKPQREGGAHNFYGTDIVRVLSQATTEERQQYIVQSKINSPALPVCAIGQEEQPARLDGTVELGFYGVQVAKGDRVFYNAVPGYLMRTKAAYAREAGVAAGFGILDVPMLIE